MIKLDLNIKNYFLEILPLVELKLMAKKDYMKIQSDHEVQKLIWINLEMNYEGDMMMFDKVFEE